MEIWKIKDRKWDKTPFLAFPFDGVSLEAVIRTHAQDAQQNEMHFLVFSQAEEKALAGLMSGIVEGQCTRTFLRRLFPAQRRGGRGNCRENTIAYVLETGPFLRRSQNLSKRLAIAFNLPLTGPGALPARNTVWCLNEPGQTRWIFPKATN